MSHDQESGPERRSEIRQRAGDRATQVGQARDVTVVRGDLVYQPATVPAPPTYVEPRRPRWRRTVALVVILVVVGSLVLSVLTQPREAPSQPETTTIPLGSLFWIGQVMVSFIVILAALAEFSGLTVRELFSTRPAGASAEAFPFHIIRDFDELLDYLFPDPSEPLLSDRSIPYLPRIASELDAAFRRRGHVLIRGRSKTGKTREAVEVLRRWWYTGPTVLLAKHHVGLYPPYRIPDTLPVRNLILFFDDVDRYCGDDDAVKRLDQTIAFFADLCHEPGELQVIATARREPEFWDKLRYDKTVSPWASFELLSLSALPSDVARRLIDHLAGACGMAMDPTTADDMTSKNDGTFLNLVLSFRGWLHEGVTQIGLEQAAAFEGNLVTTWRRRYERLVGALPEAGPIYAAVDLLQRLDVPLRRVLITDLATEMSLSRTCHLLDGLLHWVRNKLELSPRLDWYRDPRRRRRWIAMGVLVALLAFYVLSYLFLRFVPAKFQFDFFNALEDELWLQLLLLSPLLIPLIPLALSLSLGWHRRRKRRRVQGALDCLLVTEVPLRGDELRPYESQFEGNGTSRAWLPTFFAGQDGTAPFSRLAAPRLAGTYLAWAEELRVAGELGPARSLAKLAGVLAPVHPMSSFVLGKLWYDEGDLRRALAEFTRSRTLNPSASAGLALERISWCFYQLEEFDQAETVAGQALALMPTLSAARWARGLARLQRGQVEAGLADCRQAAAAKEALPPDLAAALGSALTAVSSQSWAGRVSHLLQRDSPSRKRYTALWRRVRWGLAVGVVLTSALAALLSASYLGRKVREDVTFNLWRMDILLRLYPHAPAALTERGYVYKELGDYERAIADCTKAIRLDPDFVVAYNNRGWAYYGLGDYEQAIADFNRAIEIDSEHANAYHGRGWTYYMLGDYERAITEYTRAIELNHDPLSWPYHGRGKAYYILGDYEHAIADYTEAIRIDPDYTWAYIERGDAYLQIGNYDQAIADYTEVIRIAPDSARGYIERGDAYLQLGDYERGIADFTETIRLDPDSAWGYSERGDAYLQIGNYDQAIADYTEAIRLDPDFATAYAGRGKVYRELGDYERAIADHTEAMRLAPDDAFAYRERGWDYYELGEYEQAIADFNRALEIDPEHANAYHGLGWTYYHLGDYERAIAEYTHAIELNHDPLSWPYHGRGKAYYILGDYEHAIADYTEAIRIDPDYARAYNALSWAYEELGDYERAVADFTEIIHIAPDSAWGYIERGDAYLQMGDYEHAIADYTEAIRINPYNAWTYIERGEAYLQMGDYEHAIADYTEAIRIDPDYARAYNALSWAYEELGDYERAVADFTEIIRIAPGSAWGYIERGDAYLQMGDYEHAIADFTEIIRIAPDDAWAYIERGDAYLQMGDYEHAIADYTEAIRLTPDSAWAYTERGDAYLQMGDYEHAIADYTEAIRVDPDSAWAYTERGDAYRQMGNYEHAIADYTEAIRLDPDYAHAHRNRGTVHKDQGDLIAARADWERAIEIYEAQGQPDYAEEVRGWLSEL